MKQDKRYLKTEKIIREEFYNLLKSESYKNITIEKLCENAMISKNTFYSHYNGKDALLDSIVASFSIAPILYLEELKVTKKTDDSTFADLVINNSFERLEQNFNSFYLLFKNDSYINFSDRLLNQCRKHFLDYADTNGNKTIDTMTVIMIDSTTAGIIKMQKDYVFHKDEISLEQIKNLAKKIYLDTIKQLLVKACF